MAGLQIVGLGSGLDTQAIIKSLLTVKALPNVRREAEINYLQAKDNALNSLFQKITELNKAVEKFSASNGSGVKFTTNVSDPSVASAVAGSNATIGSYDINVESLARNAAGSFSNTFSSIDDYVGAGTIDITVGTGGQTVSFNTDASTTLSDLAQQINDSAELKGKATASIVNTGTNSNPQYKLMISTTNEGLDEGLLQVATSGSMNTGSFDVVQAENAKFTVAGIAGTIEKSSNSVSDVFTGVTLNLTGVGQTHIEVKKDNAAVSTMMQDVVSKFNDLIEFAKDQNSIVSSGSNNDSLVFGALAKTKVDENFISQFKSLLAGASSASGTAVKHMSELGISTNRDGTLAFDAAKFEAAMASDSDGAFEVLGNFAESISGSTGLTNSYIKFQGIIEQERTATDTRIKSINNDIDKLNKFLENYQDTLTRQFAMLESLMGKMQASGNAITSLFSGLDGLYKK